MEDNLFLNPVGVYEIPAWEKLDNLSTFNDKFSISPPISHDTFTLNDEIQKPGKSIKVEVRKMKLIEGSNYVLSSPNVCRHFGHKHALSKIILPQNRITQIVFSDLDECKRLRNDINFDNSWVTFFMRNPGESSFRHRFLSLTFKGTSDDYTLFCSGTDYYFDPKLEHYFIVPVK